MRIDIITLFPSMFEQPFQESIIGRARNKNLVEIKVWNLRDFSTDKHKTVDDYPFGGGSGMVLKVEPFFRALEHIRSQENDIPTSKTKILLMSPQGEVFTQKKAQDLKCFDQLIILCGHYEGFDERIRQYLVDEELSIGDYVLTGGELPAMVITDAIVRLLPGALGGEDATANDSFAQGLLEYPQYTRPREFAGYLVPDILLSGNHQQIEKWRHQQSLLRTMDRRPDLIAKINLLPEDKQFLKEKGRIGKD